MSASPHLTTAECADYLRRPVCTIRKWVHQRRIPFRKINGCVLFAKTELDAWIESQTFAPKEVSSSRFQEVRERLRSLKTEFTTADHPPPQRKVG